LSSPIPVNQEIFKPDSETLLPSSELDDLAEVSADDIDDAIGDWKAAPPILAFADLLEAETDA
jgi:hypothetical protein